ncbi:MULTISPECIES: hypothetical protein [Actibacterium]|uniref:Uncharacterized protein n=1 Tax=Actibacterium naphthalenivorans TaxID=1614693 RepID=A0A840C3Y4_9RHOB|nr:MULTISPECIES: hypothetical protein [Actibacterium]ALG89857.1 hypothetical protein TQ29_06175 [Actibacterium sp. EMB200-NS6]MBB4020424.1 hypothetical protein [Actibacterium naphthalenivorans]
MSAPQTDVETQKKRHRIALWGSVLTALFGFVLIMWWVIEEAASVDSPEGADVRIDGRTGEEIQADEPAPVEEPQ